MAGELYGQLGRDGLPEQLRRLLAAIGGGRRGGGSFGGAGASGSFDPEPDISDPSRFPLFMPDLLGGAGSSAQGGPQIGMPLQQPSPGPVTQGTPVSEPSKSIAEITTPTEDWPATSPVIPSSFQEPLKPQPDQPKEAPQTTLKQIQMAGATRAPVGYYPPMDDRPDEEPLGLSPGDEPIADIEKFNEAAPPVVHDVPGTGTMADVLRRLNPDRPAFSWGKDVELDPTTGRPTTSTVLTDPLSHRPARDEQGAVRYANEAVGGGGTFSGGGTDEDYLRYRANSEGWDPAQLEAAKRSVERLRTGVGPAQPTAGELLDISQKQEQAQYVAARQAAEEQQNASDMATDLAALDAQEQEIASRLKAGRTPAGAAYTETEHALDKQKIAADRKMVQEKFRAWLYRNMPAAAAAAIKQDSDFQG